MKVYEPIDNLRTKLIDAADKITLDKIHRDKDIRKSEGWKPRRNGPQCVGCTRADINVISVHRNGYEANELSVWCKNKRRIISKPYELCIYRTEKPTHTLTDFIQKHL